MTVLNEKILPDEYPVHGNYLYVCDGEVVRSDIMNRTVKDLKADLRGYYKLAAKEIKNCDFINRRKLAQLEKQELSNLREEIVKRNIGEYNKPSYCFCTLQEIDRLLNLNKTK